MKLSFIITTYNVAPYIDKCLDSLTRCLRPGDEVIVVDDGSADQTDMLVERRLAAGFGSDIACRAILLGTNTMGGVGIPANIGLTHATREAVFFVDGDDWLDAEGFTACRAAFDAQQPDILIGNYIEFDETTGTARLPFDMNRWAGLPAANDAKARQLLALSMIAVPWRKFYRRDFLTRTGIRFPEGDFFYEDNPFHWDICLNATTIGFHDRALSYHRVNRAGQTMAATGTELMAFFDHFETISAKIDPSDTALRTAALEWLVNNMSWHVGRLHHGAFWDYADRAAEVLHDQTPYWPVLRKKYAGFAIGAMVSALMRGEVAGTVAAWMAERTHNNLAASEQRLQQSLSWLLARVDATVDKTDQIYDLVHADSLIQEFRALRALTETLPSDPTGTNRRTHP